jgi:hypothetical protein
VIQEIALARKAWLHCGNNIVPWDNFANAIRLFEERTETIERHFIKVPEFGHRLELVSDIKAMTATRLGAYMKHVKWRLMIV